MAGLAVGTSYDDDDEFDGFAHPTALSTPASTSRSVMPFLPPGSRLLETDSSLLFRRDALSSRNRCVVAKRRTSNRCWSPCPAPRRRGINPGCKPATSPRLGDCPLIDSSLWIPK